MSNRAGARLAALAVALLLSKSQHRFFDCNKVPFLSYVAGVVTLLIVYGTVERTHDVLTSELPGGRQSAVVTIVIGCIAIGAAGFFTMLTHICP
jgi:hypothetical protein